MCHTTTGVLAGFSKSLQPSLAVIKIYPGILAAPCGDTNIQKSAIVYFDNSPLSKPLIKEEATTRSHDLCMLSHTAKFRTLAPHADKDPSLILRFPTAICCMSIPPLLRSASPPAFSPLIGQSYWKFILHLPSFNIATLSSFISHTKLFLGSFHSISAPLCLWPTLVYFDAPLYHPLNLNLFSSPPCHTFTTSQKTALYSHTKQNQFISQCTLN